MAWEVNSLWVAGAGLVCACGFRCSLVWLCPPPLSAGLVDCLRGLCPSFFGAFCFGVRSQTRRRRRTDSRSDDQRCCGLARSFHAATRLSTGCGVFCFALPPSSLTAAALVRNKHMLSVPRLRLTCRSGHLWRLALPPSCSVAAWVSLLASPFYAAAPRVELFRSALDVVQCTGTPHLHGRKASFSLLPVLLLLTLWLSCAALHASLLSRFFAGSRRTSRLRLLCVFEAPLFLVWVYSRAWASPRAWRCAHFLLVSFRPFNVFCPSWPLRPTLPASL